MIEHLEELLQAKKWRAANAETCRLLAGAGVNIPPDQELLAAADQLWVLHSNSCFGFSVQRALFTKLNGDAHAFGSEVWDAFERLADAIGWRDGNWWVSWSDTAPTSDEILYPKLSADDRTDPSQLVYGCLPFHDILSSGDWETEFEVRDAWGEAHWSDWQALFRALPEP